MSDDDAHKTEQENVLRLIEEIKVLDEDTKKGFSALNDTLNKILNLFLQYDKSYNEDMMKEHHVE